MVSCLQHNGQLVGRDHYTLLLYRQGKAHFLVRDGNISFLWGGRGGKSQVSPSLPPPPPTLYGTLGLLQPISDYYNIDAAATL